MAIAVTDFIRLALSEIRAARAGDVVSPDDANDALLIFNELLDALNVDDRALYTVNFHTFTLTPNHQPHTIGISANTPDFTVTIGRPTKILSGNIILANNIRKPLELLDDDGWNRISAGAAAGQAVTITASVDTYLYYTPDYPNGSLYLWPVPSTAYGLELRTNTLLAQVALTDTFDLPFGYQQALRLTLTELLAPHFGQPISPETANNARKARALVWGNNDVIPNLTTRDAGMPNGSMSRGNRYNYLTGLMDAGTQ